MRNFLSRSGDSWSEWLRKDTTQQGFLLLILVFAIIASFASMGTSIR